MVSVKIVHCSLLTLNRQYARYLRLGGIIAYHRSFCVVDFSVSDYCETLIPHIFLKSSGVVLECWYADKKARGCLMSVRLFGGSGTVSMWMPITSCSVTSLETCRFCFLVSHYINISCFPDIRTLTTSIWLKHCVLNMMSSSFAILRSSYSIDL